MGHPPGGCSGSERPHGALKERSGGASESEFGDHVAVVTWLELKRRLIRTPFLVSLVGAGQAGRLG